MMELLRGMTDFMLCDAVTPIELVDAARKVLREAHRLMRQNVVDDSGHLVFSVRLLRDEDSGATVGLRFECPTLLNCLVGDLCDEIRLDPAQRALLRAPGGRAFASSMMSMAVFTRSRDGHWVDAEVRIRNTPYYADVAMIMERFKGAPESTRDAVRKVFGWGGSMIYADAGGWWRRAHHVTLRWRSPVQG